MDEIWLPYPRLLAPCSESSLASSAPALTAALSAPVQTPFFPPQPPPPQPQQPHLHEFPVRPIAQQGTSHLDHHHFEFPQPIFSFPHEQLDLLFQRRPPDLLMGEYDRFETHDLDRKDEPQMPPLNPVFPYPIQFDMLKERKFEDEPPMEPPPPVFSAPSLPERESRPAHECQVCQTVQANGLHFGARTCAACAAFFRRTISDGKKYICKRSQRCSNPPKDGTGYRKICRACRLRRCMDIGMLPENVQHKRARHDSPPRFDPIIPPPQIPVSSSDSHLHFETLHGLRNDVSRSFESMIPFYNQLSVGHNGINS